MTTRYLSICSGIEAATQALHPLGWVPVGFAEIDPFASAVLSYRHGANLPGEPLSHNAPPNFGDFTAIPLDRLGAVDVLIGGTPCQAFSVAGRRLSLADARGNLTLSFVVLAHELARSHGLKNVWWENVPGVLSTDDNAFGCFLGALVGADAPLLPSPEPSGRAGGGDLWVWSDKAGCFRPRWPRAGMVAGPAGRAAWRVLDAQYFGLAQRRERVFVVGDFGNGADPAAVLFEPQGLRGHPPARGKAGQGSAGYAEGGADERRAFGGNRTGGAIDVAPAVNAHGGATGRLDFESEAFIAEVASTLPAGGNATGGNRLPGTSADTAGSVLVAISGHSEYGVGLPMLRAKGGYAGRRQEDDDNIVAYAIQERAVSENLDAGPQGAGIQAEVAYTLEARHHVQAVAKRWAVRRLTPVECARLQGFPDHHARIPWRGKPAEQCPDGPQYKGYGNSFPTKVIAWIGRRLDAALRERGEP